MRVHTGKREARATLFVAIFLALCMTTCESSLARRNPRTATLSLIKNGGHQSWNSLVIRGGASDDDDDYEDAVEELEDDEGTGLESSSSVMDSLFGISKRVLVVLGKATVATTKAASRAVVAAFQSDDVNDEEEEPPSFIARVVHTLQRMWTAALNPPETDEGGAESSSTAKPKAKQNGSARTEKSEADFGSFLASSFGISVDRDDDSTPVLGGTIGDALRAARSKARLLVVFIPSTRPGKKNTPDHAAIRSLLSPEVSEAAEHRARKKEESGSFVLWGAKASSPEAVTAMKRLKAKQPNKKGDKRPMLLVAYPAQVSI